jgi:hypothetical protein
MKDSGAHFYELLSKIRNLDTKNIPPNSEEVR